MCSASNRASASPEPPAANGKMMRTGSPPSWALAGDASQVRAAAMDTASNGMRANVTEFSLRKVRGQSAAVLRRRYTPIFREEAQCAYRRPWPIPPPDSGATAPLARRLHLIPRSGCGGLGPFPRGQHFRFGASCALRLPPRAQYAQSPSPAPSSGPRLPWALVSLWQHGFLPTVHFASLAFVVAKYGKDLPQAFSVTGVELLREPFLTLVDDSSHARE